MEKERYSVFNDALNTFLIRFYGVGVLDGEYDFKYMTSNNVIYHIIYKSSNRNKVHDKNGIMYFENQITMQIRSRD